MSEDFNEYQKCAVQAYANGDYSHCTTMSEVEDVGDTLLLFVVRELADSDCESAGRAIQLMETAERQLGEVASALASCGEGT